MSVHSVSAAKKKLSKCLCWINFILLVIVFVNTVIVIMTGGYSVSIGFLKLSTHNAGKSLLLLIVLAFMIRAFFPRQPSQNQEKEPAEILGVEDHLSGVKVIVILLLIVLFVFGIYHKILNGFFVSDDFEVLSIFRQFHDVSFDALFSFMKGDGLIRPLAVASTWLDHTLWAFNSRGYHLTNILLHAANSFLVFLILYSLRRKYVFGAFCALLFAAYPVHQEPVAWVANRADLLCGFFFFLALFLYVLSRKKDTLRLASALFSPIAFALALGSKEMAITLPLVIILLDWFLPCDGKRLRLRKTIFYIPYIFVLVGYVIFRILFLGNLGGYVEVHQTFLRIDPRFLYDLRNIVMRPFAALAVPLNHNLFVNPRLLKATFLLLIVAFAMLLSFRKGKNSPLIAFGAFLTVTAVLPAFRILYISKDMQGSRHLYLAALGSSIIISGTIESFNRIARRMISVWLAIGSIIFLGFLTGISYIQTTPWVHASDLSRKIVNEGVRSLSPVKPGSTVYVVDLPDNEQGAYVFRNGFPSAMHLAGISDDIHIIELWKILPSEIAKRDGNLVMQWKGTAFWLSEWTFDQIISAAKKR